MPDDHRKRLSRQHRRLGLVSHSVIAAFGLAAIAAHTPAHADEAGQVAQAAPQQSAPATTLPPVSAEGVKDEDYKTDTVSSPKITTPLKDTPQTINVVPRQLIEDQGVTTLRDVLRNVPGISMQAGEGGVPQGDSLTLRGFAARTDMFMDGIRDFGTYYRDPFNYESVEVSKGPNSTYGGRGSTGGQINQVSKKPLAGFFAEGTATVGTDETLRGTIDINTPIDAIPNAAFRLNLMGHQSDVAGRDLVEKERWGIAPSITFGMNTETQLTLSYFHLTQDEMPDRGVPFVNNNPAPVDRDTFYGIRGRDYYHAEVDLVTAEFNHRFDEMFSVRNMTRLGRSAHDYIVSTPTGVNFGAGTINPGSHNRDALDTIMINQTDLTTKFATGSYDHTLVTGIEVASETSENKARTTAGTSTSLYDPNPDRAFTGPTYSGAKTEGDANSVAAYAFDTIALSPQWDFLIGGRYDYIDTEVASTAVGGAVTPFGRIDKEFSWRTGLVYKPMTNGSIYASYGTSFNPSGERLTLNANTQSVPPEETQTYEVGTKWDLFNEQLSLTGAIFRIEKTNARTADPLGGTVQVLDGEQRVDGFELGASGTLMPGWKVYGGYTYLDGNVIKSNTASQVGRRPINVAPHSFNFWTTYDVTNDLTLGFGGQYLDKRIPGNAESGFASSSTNVVPSYMIFDAMVSYSVTEQVALQLNVYNITDEVYYDAAYSGFTVPGASRTALLTLKYEY
ncbi:MAG: TonB-dependent receptor [Alphaproteobacteria bacterium]